MKQMNFSGGNEFSKPAEANKDLKSLKTLISSAENRSKNVELLPWFLNSGGSENVKNKARPGSEEVLGVEKRKVEIRIQGKDYTIVSADSEEYIRSVAFLTDKKFGEVAVAAPQLSTAMTAVLVSLNLADDYLKSEKSCDNLRQQVAYYLEENNKMGNEINRYKEENNELNAKVRELEIELAKRNTELNELRSRINK